MSGPITSEEEPQEERGEPGSRDKGASGPEGGPVDRPSGKSEPTDYTGIKPEEPIDDDAPILQPGD